MFEMSFASMVVVLVIIIWVKGGIRKAGEETKEVLQTASNTVLIGVRMAEETSAHYANNLSIYFLKNMMENADSLKLLAKHQINQATIRRHIDGRSTIEEAKRINALIKEGTALLKS